MKNIKFAFKYKTTAFDLWRLSMYGIYSSILGVCNLIFTVTMILLTFKFWEDASQVIRVILIFAICLFILIQPVAIYLKAEKQVLKLPGEIQIDFADAGVHVKIENQSSTLPWTSIKGITKRPGMLIIFSTAKHGFILNNKVLLGQKKPFYDYVVSKIKKK